MEARSSPSTTNTYENSPEIPSETLNSQDFEPERPIDSEILPEHVDLRKKIAYHRDLAATAREELNFSEALDQLQQARQVCDELMDAAITKQVSQEFRAIQAEVKQKEQERQEQKRQEQKRQRTRS